MIKDIYCDLKDIILVLDDIYQIEKNPKPIKATHPPRFREDTFSFTLL